jgi:hypothetical protein
MKRPWGRLQNFFIYWRQRWREWRCGIRTAKILAGDRPVSRRWLGQTYDHVDAIYDRYDESCLCTLMDRSRAIDYACKALSFTTLEPLRRIIAGHLDTNPDVDSPAIFCEFACESSWHTHIFERSKLGDPRHFDPDDPDAMAGDVRFAYYRPEPPRPGMLPIMMNWPDPDYGEVRVLDWIDDPRVVAGSPLTLDVDGRTLPGD